VAPAPRAAAALARRADRRRRAAARRGPACAHAPPAAAHRRAPERPSRVHRPAGVSARGDSSMKSFLIAAGVAGAVLIVLWPLVYGLMVIVRNWTQPPRPGSEA